MPANYDKFQAALDALTAQVAETESVEAGATTLIVGFADQIKAAVAADNTIDQATTDQLASIVDGVTARFKASSQPLADAVVANTPSAP